MGNILIKKVKLLDVFIYALALYPLLKFNFSSIVLFGLLTIIVYKSFKLRAICFSKKRVKSFLFFTIFFFILTISAFYSDDKQDALKKISRLLPLLLIPGILIFCKPFISVSNRTMALRVFLVSNILFLFILFCVYHYSNELIEFYKFSFGEALVNHAEFQHAIDQHLGRDMLFVHKAYFSMGFVILSVFSIMEAIKYYNKRNVICILYVFSFFFFSFFIIYVFSFPNVIALIVSIALVMVYNVNWQNLKLRNLLVGFVLIIVLSAGLANKFESNDVKRGLNFIESIFTNEKIEFNDPRIEVYANVKSLYNKAFLNEIIFGYGVGDVDSLLNTESELRLSKYDSKNMLMFSEEFNNSYWHLNNTEVLQNETLSPDNTETADALKEYNTVEESSFNISKEIELDKPKELTFSVYAKQGSANHLILRMGNIHNRVTFNLEAGTYDAMNKQIKATIEKVGDWYRCSITSRLEQDFLLIIGLSNDKNKYKYKGESKSLYLWGAQLEESKITTSYENKNIELLKYVSDKQLNTHNNYLYFLLSAGILGILSFLISLIGLFYISFRNKNIYQLTFCIIIAVNFLTENILSRHWGLVFVSFMLILFYSNNNKSFEPEIKKSI